MEEDNRRPSKTNVIRVVANYIGRVIKGKTDPFSIYESSFDAVRISRRNDVSWHVTFQFFFSPVLIRPSFI